MLVFRLAMLALLLSSAGVLQAEDRVVLATVNGEEITSNDILRELYNIHSAQTDEVSRGGFNIERLLQKLINDRLLAQDARDLGLNQEKTITDAVRWFRETQAFELLVQDISPASFDIPDEEIRAEFEKQYRRVMLRILCVADSANSAAICDSILNQGVSMASLAKSHAIDKFKDVGGDAGMFPLFDLPEHLAKKIEAVPAGTLVGPMMLWRTWALARADNILPAEEELYDSVKVILKNYLGMKHGTKFRKDFIAREGASIPVMVDSVAIDSIPARFQAGAEGVNTIVMRIGKDRTMTSSDLQNKFTHRFISRGDLNQWDVLYEVLDEQYDLMMLKEIAKLRKYVEDPRIDSTAVLFEDSMLVVQYLQSVISPTIKISDAEIQEYYDSHPEKYLEPGRVQVAILSRATLEEAQADYDKILSGADFTWIAKQYSTDEFKDRGGLRDWSSMTQFPPAIAAQLDTLPVGQCLPPLVGSESFAVMKLVARERGARRPLADVRDVIKAAITSRKEYEAIDATLKDLRANSQISINEAALNSMQVSAPAEN